MVNLIDDSASDEWLESRSSSSSPSATVRVAGVPSTGSNGAFYTITCRVCLHHATTDRSTALEIDARRAAVGYMLASGAIVNDARVRVLPTTQLPYENTIVDVELVVARRRKDGQSKAAACRRLLRDFCAVKCEKDSPSLQIMDDDAHVDSCDPELGDQVLRSVTLGSVSSVAHYHAAFTAHATHVGVEKNISDSVAFTTWCTFEHDKRELNVYIVHDNSEYTHEEKHLHTQQLLYRFTVTYGSIRQVICDDAFQRESSTGSSTRNMFFLLRHPPQLWKSVPRTADLNRNQQYAVLSYKKCNDWLRVRCVDGGERELLTAQHLATMDVIGLAFPRQQWPPRCMRTPYIVDNEQYVHHSCLHVDECDCELPMTTHRTEIPLSNEVLYALQGRLKQRLRAFNAQVITQQMHWRVNQLAEETMHCVELDDLIAEATTPHMSYAARYLIHALRDRPSSVASGLTAELCRRLRQSFDEDARACEAALEQLLLAVDQHRPLELQYAFGRLYETCRVANIRRERQGEVDAMDQPLEQCCYIRKVIVTPTRTMFLPPEMMMTNRVVRQFGEEHLIRCVFRDDDNTKLNNYKFRTMLPRGASWKRNNKTDPDSFDMNHQSTAADYEPPPVVAEFASIIHSALHRPGVTAAGRLYQFLGWSNSQMRDHGCYLVAEIPVELLPEIVSAVLANPQLGASHNRSRGHLSARTLRAYMGDFTNCESLPKMMSRIGQCFSQAQLTVDMRHIRWTCEKDLMGGGSADGRGKQEYNFTDGIGRMSMRVARSIAEMLQLDYVPCAVQVRFKGYKGMLAVHTMLDRVDQFHVIFRDSQCKFDDVFETSHHLEIVKYAMPSEVCLNRPFINIIDQVSARQQEKSGRASTSSLGLHDRICRFVHLVCESEMFACATMLTDERRSAFALNERASCAIDARRLSKAGIELTCEPFFRSLLLACHKYAMTQQVARAKVRVPPEFGRTLYGVVDETGTLMPGQVHIRYSRSLHCPTVDPITVVGRVLVTKNPCLNAGDVRVFDAVDLSQLAHMIDVIVFPRFGQRPHPDEMAGSDLDGDEYSVFWHNYLLFDANERASDFPSLKATPLDGRVPSDTEMADFFVSYLTQDAIGTIGTAHLAQSDRLGIFSTIAERIAHKNSIAVDFPKTGKPARPLSAAERANVRPDFMISIGKRSYMSHRLAGRLHRQSRCVEQLLYLTQPLLDDDWSVDDDLRADWSEMPNSGVDVMKEALRVRDAYHAHILKLLDTYGIEDEAQLVSGKLSTLKNRLNEMEKDDYSYYNTDKVVQLRYAQLAENYRRQFFAEFGSEEEYIRSNEVHTVPLAMRQKALAWYTVVYDAQYGNTTGYRSMPWIVWDIIAYYKRAKTYLRAGASINERHSSKILARIGRPIVDTWLLRDGEARMGGSATEEQTEFARRAKRDVVAGHPMLAAYSYAYGAPFDVCVTALLYWALKENVETSRQDIALIFTAIATQIVAYDSSSVIAIEGDAESADDRDLRRDPPSFAHCATKEDVDRLANGGVKGYKFDETRDGELSEFVARTLLYVLRHLSGVEFRAALTIDISQNTPLTDGWPGVALTDGAQSYLSVAAFRLYTHMSLSASPHALHLRAASITANAEPLQELVNSHVVVLTDAKVSADVLTPSLVERRLTDWSQCHSVRLRCRQMRPAMNRSSTAAGGFGGARVNYQATPHLLCFSEEEGDATHTRPKHQPDSEYFVSALGTPTALQRLNVMLQLPDWRQRVVDDKIPPYDMLNNVF